MLIQLSPEEWDSFSRERMHDDDSGLPVCCANISALRDVILEIHENGGEMTDGLFAKLRWAWEAACSSHDFPDACFATLRKLIELAGLPEWTELQNDTSE